ncbi:hypothetical protein DYB28_000706 [Aphanomyces astaci]|uniref:Uncharacterized protein n=1 Tax=Aphanomyces astaci TaxID=112090 RepID=A0A397ES05_APHAT|nr:hypothetical protein DYB25_008233 [Aphanomyces astaci]RHY51360.1 hypothetical protein DYB38_004582 [Aphanomyces astaci]RHY66128.1 hypothetical protein DYB30_003785 [Aphanomyces astaci]RHY69512.1 hypothetical protein DYB34_010309 [Aphanomyces astaci]RHY96520.1 hypothetical protein DYB31_010606 [Aphanomyces astaci]
MVAWAVGPGLKRVALYDGIGDPKGTMGTQEHNDVDVPEKEVSTSRGYPSLGGALDGGPKELLAVFTEAAVEGETKAFLAYGLDLFAVVYDAE